MRKSSDHSKKIALLLGDTFLIVVSVGLSVALRLRPVMVIGYYTGATVFVVVSYLLCFYIFDLYNFKRGFTDALVLAQHLTAIFVGTIMSTTAFYVFLHWKFGRGIVLLTAFFAAVFSLLWRILFEKIFVSSGKKKNIIIAGAGESGRAMYEVLKNSEIYEVVGFVDDAPSNMGKNLGDCKVIGNSNDISRLISEKNIEGIVVAITYEKRKELLSALMQAKLSGVGIYDMQVMYESISGKLPADHLCEGWLAFADLQGAEKGMYKIKVKRIISFCLALFFIVFSLPITTITMIAVWIESGRPVFFRQKRVGLNGKIFEIVKFRSMSPDAEIGGAVWAKEKDPRITRVGRLIRKLRIDEIPQFWNVLKGEMSLVGPRPERPEFVESLQKTIPFYFIRHVVKPGITGWAQVNYRYGSSREDSLEKLQYDLYYVKNLSFFLDVRIILKTIRVVLFGTGAR